MLRFFASFCVPVSLLAACNMPSSGSTWPIASNAIFDETGDGSEGREVRDSVELAPPVTELECCAPDGTCRRTTTAECTEERRRLRPQVLEMPEPVDVYDVAHITRDRRITPRDADGPVRPDWPIIDRLSWFMDHERTELVVEGVIQRAEGFISPHDHFARTWCDLDITHIFKGPPEVQQIRFLTQGGSVNGEHYFISHMPTCVVGERVALIAWQGVDSFIPAGGETFYFREATGTLNDRTRAVLEFLALAVQP